MKDSYWTQLKWPAAPNDDDYKVYERYCQGKVLLLGSTKTLLPLANEAWDIEPQYPIAKIKKRDWLTLDEHWDTIILDGGLNLGKDFARDILRVVLPNCNRFVCRAFLNPTWQPRYANYFPKANELDPQPSEHSISEVYTFYIWNQKQSS